MGPITFAAIALVLMLLSVGAGITIRKHLPEHHVTGDSKDVIKLSIALIATMSALVLALLFASTRTSFERTTTLISRMTADITELDRVLDRYGTETATMRMGLRLGIEPLIDSIWQEDARARGITPEATQAQGEALLYRLQDLEPKTSIQRALHARATHIAQDLYEIHLALLSQPVDPVAQTFMIVLVLWLMFIFTTFSLTSAPNPTLITILCLCVLSASAAIYLIEELRQPFDGLMQISSDGLRKALK